ncbi:hypothetical protein N665_0283s0014 [Sinapis alba]|nr:hypothetical protein N665_0283s0014 [Sinapis alba]
MIQASVKHKLIKKYKRELKQGEYLDVMNFKVLDNNDDYKGTTHPYKINFIYTTYVKTSEMIPNLFRFNLSPFPDFFSQSNVDDVFKVFDYFFYFCVYILGEIVGMGEITDINYAGNLTKLLDIQLRDLRFFLNEDINDISEFKKSTCTTSASILAFQKERPWWYVGCKVCCSTATSYFNLVSEKIEAKKYSCDTCQKNETTTSIRYKVQVKFNREKEVLQELIDLEKGKIASIIRVTCTKKNYQQPSFKIVGAHSDLAISSNTCSIMHNKSSEANNDLPHCSHMTPNTKRPQSHMIDDEGIQESSTKPKETSKMAKEENGNGVGKVKKESTKSKH